MQMKEIYSNGYLPWKNHHSTDPHIIFLTPFLFISDYLPGESTGETPTTGKYYISIAYLLERINEHTSVD